MSARHEGQPVRRRRPSSGRVGFVGPTADVEASAETSGFVFIRYGVKFHGPDLDDVFGVQVGDELVGVGQIGQGLPEGLKAGGSVIVIVGVRDKSFVSFGLRREVGGRDQGNGQAAVPGLHPADHLLELLGADGDLRQGVLVALVPFIMVATNLPEAEINTIIGYIVDVVFYGTALVSAVMTIWGLIRKAVNGRWSAAE